MHFNVKPHCLFVYIQLMLKMIFYFRLFSGFIGKSSLYLEVALRTCLNKNVASANNTCSKTTLKTHFLPVAEQNGPEALQTRATYYLAVC